jgi:DNA processing protein
MEQAEKEAVTFLWSVDGVGPKTYRKLAKVLELEGATWQDFWAAAAAFLHKIAAPEKLLESIKLRQKEHTVSTYFESLRARNIQVVTEDELGYPALLCEVESRPPLLFARGNLAVRMACPVAVVGTRRMTVYGERATHKIVGELVLGGASIVSGFMYGVDATAHEAALEAEGATVGVLGYGFDHLFPQSQRRLFEQVLEAGGLFVSELAPHVAPRAGNFPARNRLVAGMSLAVVVVEAAAESGSHITARLAAEEGREVCAVPGPITNPYSEGTKVLLNDGARLITSGWDVLAELPKQAVLTTTSLKNNAGSSLHDRILQRLQLLSCSASVLSDELQESIAVILQELTLLELQGVVERKGTEFVLTHAV